VSPRADEQRSLDGSAYGQDVPGGRHVTLVTTSSGHA